MENVTFEITKKSYDVVLWAISVARSFANDEWEKGMEKLFQNAFSSPTKFTSTWKQELAVLKQNYFCKDEKLNKILVQTYDDFILHLKNEITLEDDTIHFSIPYQSSIYWDYISRSLEFVVRMVLGQWEELYMFCKGESFKSFQELNKYRSMLPFYRLHNIYGSASFGIYSKHINENIRILYDFYKVMQFEVGIGGVWGYTPNNVSTESLPKINFPYLSCFQVSEKLSSDELEKIEQWALQSHRIFQKENEKLYLPIKDYCYHEVVANETIYIKRNGFFTFNNISINEVEQNEDH